MQEAGYEAGKSGNQMVVYRPGPGLSVQRGDLAREVVGGRTDDDLHDAAGADDPEGPGGPKGVLVDLLLILDLNAQPRDAGLEILDVVPTSQAADDLLSSTTHVRSSCISCVFSSAALSGAARRLVISVARRCPFVPVRARHHFILGGLSLAQQALQESRAELPGDSPRAPPGTPSETPSKLPRDSRGTMIGRGHVTRYSSDGGNETSNALPGHNGP